VDLAVVEVPEFDVEVVGQWLRPSVPRYGAVRVT
jgi:hypothetical protein